MHDSFCYWYKIDETSHLLFINLFWFQVIIADLEQFLCVHTYFIISKEMKANQGRYLPPRLDFLYKKLSLSEQLCL